MAMNKERVPDRMNTVRMGIASARGPKRIMPEGCAREDENERIAMVRPIIPVSVVTSAQKIYGIFFSDRCSPYQQERN